MKTHGTPALLRKDCSTNLRRSWRRISYSQRPCSSIFRRPALNRAAATMRRQSTTTSAAPTQNTAGIDQPPFGSGLLWASGAWVSMGKWRRSTVGCRAGDAGWRAARGDPSFFARWDGVADLLDLGAQLPVAVAGGG